jgi:8-oxo-dGTP diphosphatase
MPILAAGGVVFRAGAKPQIAVVQRSKDNGWVLPKGKLKPKENAISAARREASEETGYDVDVREFLGVISYWTSSRPKVVHFWRMQAADAPGRTLTSDIKALEWLPLASAIERLSTPHERAFLQQVGRHAVELMEPMRRKARARKRIAGGRLRDTSRDRSRWS